MGMSERFNKNIVILTETSILFYYNNLLLIPKENENMPLYEYQKYSDIKQTNNIKNISLLEFNNNFIIVISASLRNSIIDRYYLTFTSFEFLTTIKIYYIFLISL